MAGLFGIGLTSAGKISEAELAELTRGLFIQNQTCGMKASGLSILRERSAHVIRRPCSAGELVNRDDFKEFMEDNIRLKGANKTISVMGHCRLPEKGSKLNNANNHPQIVGSIIGVHHGLITNDDMLFNKYNIHRAVEVDSEVIFQLIRLHNVYRMEPTIKAIKKTAESLQGSFACAVQNTKHPYNLYLFRRDNPLVVTYYKNIDAVIFSTREYFITASANTVLPNTPTVLKDKIKLDDDCGIAIDLLEKKISRFKLKRKKIGYVE
ncbi:MAG: hypothetical protein PVG39_18420 [Desulfobacteraceae bacterium]|jgi:glucosamine 6-phosphate synthetase-like amidotransferase/phosphosugar isomerase protein